MTLEDRFWPKVARAASGECWEWQGDRNQAGYGRIRVGDKRKLAHRVAWRLTFGPIPKGDGYHGTCVLHRCDNPACVNPSHLWLGTQTENAADMAEKGRAWSPLALQNARKTHCPNGHEYTAENTYEYASGRKCKTCVSKRMRDYYRRNRAKVKSRIYARRNANV